MDAPTGRGALSRMERDGRFLRSRYRGPGPSRKMKFIRENPGFYGQDDIERVFRIKLLFWVDKSFRKIRMRKCGLETLPDCRSGENDWFMMYVPYALRL